MYTQKKLRMRIEKNLVKVSYGMTAFIYFLYDIVAHRYDIKYGNYYVYDHYIQYNIHVRNKNRNAFASRNLKYVVLSIGRWMRRVIFNYFGLTVGLA